MGNATTRLVDESDIRVLLLDDDPDYLALVSDILSDAEIRKYHVTGVTSLEQAMRALDEMDVHVCLCDFRLGANTGLDLLRHAQEVGSSVPIIILTGQGDLTVDIEVMKLGAMDYFPKDELSPGTLERSIRYAIERKRVEQESLRLERQLRQAQKMDTIGTLAGGIAHDFNNILTPILGYTEMILEEQQLTGRAREDLQEVINAANRAKDLVRQILTFSRQVEMDPKSVDLSVTINEALRLLRASIPSTIEIRPRIQAENVSVVADSSQIHQVVMNLCTNAFHAMETKGSVLDISLSSVYIDESTAASYANLKAGRFVRLSVSDDGCGMTREVQDRIFEPFFTTKEVGRGTGLGLSVVHGIVTKIGGTLMVYSEPGHGTSFTIYFPVADAEKSDDSNSDIAIPRGNERVLIVDDEPAIARLAARILERLGYTTTFFTASPEALQAFKSAPDKYDVVLSDQSMPKISGHELVEELRKIKPSVAIVLMTGFSDAAHATEYPEVHHAQISKPLLSHDLALKIRQALKS